jgi:hypothetical protein
MMRFGLIASALAALTLLTACGSNLDVQMATREIAADPDTALAAGQSVLRHEFDRLTVDHAARRITSEPQEFVTQTESLTSRDFVGARTTLRRVATMSVVARGESRSQVRLRIDRQREDTTRTEQASAGQYRLSDSPAYTPIERDAGTTTKQNTVWTSIGRDSKLERELLGELERQFSKAADDVEAARNEPGVGRQVTGKSSPVANQRPSATAPAAENR